ncbi:MAG: glycoside hydrolase, partial [Candidatus Aminicenantes bacterium]|nr:glycoside hydrolase [Candidatus Aminicenantes bacterium]
MSKNNRAACAAHPARVPAIIAVLTILALVVVGLACKPASDRAAPPSPRPSARILTNQVGYEPLAAKKAVIQAYSGDSFATFAVKRFPGGETILSGTPVHTGPVARWKDWDFWTIDWSAVIAEGTYVIECASPHDSSSSGSSPASPLLRSHPILVQKNALLRNTLSDVVYYLKGQRSSGLWDKADRAMTFEGRSGVVDVRGAWFDATGDYGKHLSHLSYSSYFNPQQVSLTAWVLFRALSALEERDGPAGAEPATKQYRKRLLDEALYGADSLVRLKDPNGSFYITVSGRGPEKKPEDRRITPKAERHIILTPETKDKFRDYGREKIAGDAAYEAGYREGAGLCIAALAMAAARSGAPGAEGYGVSRGEGDFTAAAYLKTAEDAFAFLEKNNLLFTNDGKENIVDDYCALIAAVPLYAVTGKPVYKEAADRRAASLMARLATWSADDGKHVYTDYWRAESAGTAAGGGANDRPFFHPVDAGLPVVALLEYAALADPADRTKALAAVARSLAFELAITDEVTNPFDYSRQLVQSKDGAATRRSAFFFPHDTETAPWWQGENARL